MASEDTNHSYNEKIEYKMWSRKRLRRFRPRIFVLTPARNSICSWLCWPSVSWTVKQNVHHCWLTL